MAFRSLSGSSGPIRPFFAARSMAPDATVSGVLSVGANLRSAVSPWVRFTWQTASLPTSLTGVSGADIIRPATSDEADKVLDVVMHSFSMDSAWNDFMVKVEPYLKESIARIFNQEEPLCLVIPKGNRFIAASLLNPSGEDSNQLLSGPAVLVEYRNRGLGARLLHASLAALRDRGLSTVRGITRVNGVASRHVYTKFGGVEESVQLPSQTEVSQESKS